MKTLTFAVTLALVATVAGGQTPAPNSAISTAQRAFEAGQYDQALQTIAEARSRDEATSPLDTFIAAHAHLRRSQNEAARGEFNRLIESGDDTWRMVAESSIAMLDSNQAHAMEVANQATAAVDQRNAEAAEAAGGTLPPQPPDVRVRDFAAFYQLGLVRTRVEDWAGAAAAFERAAQLNPTFAYAHYYAGISYSRIKRPDRVGVFLDAFLKLAPNAPERGAVTSIMRSLRG